MTAKEIGAPKPEGRVRIVDGPVTTGRVSSDAAGGVIPWDSKKDAPGIRDDIRGQPKHPSIKKTMDISKN